MKKQFIIYCSYPYSDNPQKRTDEINARCRVIYQKAHMTANDLLLLIPHNIFDAVFDFPEGASNFWMPLCELTLILRCDALAYDPNAISPGVVWEKAFAELNEIPIFTYDELLSGKRPNVTSKLRFRKDVSEVRALKSGATQMQNNAEKWRWLAWSIAWEGCISLGQGSCGKDKKYKIFCPLIQIANTEKELLDQVLEIVEVGTINSSKSKKKRKRPTL